MKTISAIAAILVSAFAAEAVSTVSGPVYNPATTHTYYLLSSSTWSEAETFAQSMGGHLVTINDAAENTWVSGTFLNYGGITRDLWLGANDVAQEGTFRWASGEPFLYSIWEPGQPDNGFGNEDFVHMYGGAFAGNPPHLTGWFAGGWNDFNGSASYATSGGTRQIFGLVEVPEPSTLALFGCAVVALQMFGRRARRA